MKELDIFISLVFVISLTSHPTVVSGVPHSHSKLLALHGIVFNLVTGFPTGESFRLSFPFFGQKNQPQRPMLIDHRIGESASMSESYEHSDSGAVVENSSFAKRTSGTAFNRDQCLARLLCGMTVASKSSKNGEEFREYADMVAKFFNVFPGGTEISAETWEAYDDYSTEKAKSAETIDSKENSSKLRINSKKKKNPIESNFGVFDSLINQKYDKSGRSVEDDSIEAKLMLERFPQNAKIMPNERIARARKIVANLGQKLQTIQQCRRIPGCPYTFKELREKLDRNTKGGAPDLSSNSKLWNYTPLPKQKLSYKYTKNRPGLPYASSVASASSSIEQNDSLRPFQLTHQGDDEMEEIFGTPQIKIKHAPQTFQNHATRPNQIIYQKPQIQQKPTPAPFSAEKLTYGNTKLYSTIQKNHSKNTLDDETDNINKVAPIILIGNEGVDNIQVYQGDIKDLDPDVKDHIQKITSQLNKGDGEVADDDSYEYYDEDEDYEENEDDYYDDDEEEEEESSEEVDSSEEREKKKDKKKQEEAEKEKETSVRYKVTKNQRPGFTKYSQDDEADEYGNFPLSLLQAQGAPPSRYAVRRRPKPKQKKSSEKKERKNKKNRRKNSNRYKTELGSEENEGQRKQVVFENNEKPYSEEEKKVKNSATSIIQIGGRPLVPKPTVATKKKTGASKIFNMGLNFGTTVGGLGRFGQNQQQTSGSQGYGQGVKSPLNILRPSTSYGSSSGMYGMQNNMNSPVQQSSVFNALNGFPAISSFSKNRQQRKTYLDRGQ